MTTLPPRLPDLPFPPEAGAAALIARRARRRRATRAGTVGIAASVLAGLAVLAPHHDGSGLRPVQPPPPGSYETDVTVTRETVPNRPAEPCWYRGADSYEVGGADETFQVCMRVSWAASVRVGEPLTFVAEWCPLDRDLTAELDDRLYLTVESHDFIWTLPRSTNEPVTVSAQTCWHWTIRWNGVGTPWPEQITRVRLPRGTYHVSINAPPGSPSFHGAGHYDPDHPTTLTIR